MTTWEYIRDLFKPTDRIAICWKVHTENHFHQRIVTAETACTEPYQRFLRAMNAQGNNLYIGMNPIRPESRNRRKSDIAEIRRIYLDVDHDGDNVLNAITTDSSLPKPNYLLNTSPGKYQIIWNVTGFQPDQAESLMRSLCRQFHSDPATVDISRVFRLPGLHNKKYGATFQVTARKLSSTVYTPQDFPAAAPDPATTTAPRGQRAASPSPRNTQSERDWAYCCRALWPDPNNETVIAKLLEEMERRAQGRRAKPRYYAELTVRKAREYIAGKRDLPK